MARKQRDQDGLKNNYALLSKSVFIISVCENMKSFGFLSNRSETFGFLKCLTHCLHSGNLKWGSWGKRVIPNCSHLGSLWGCTDNLEIMCPIRAYGVSRGQDKRGEERRGEGKCLPACLPGHPAPVDDTMSFLHTSLSRITLTRSLPIRLVSSSMMDFSVGVGRPRWRSFSDCHSRTSLPGSSCLTIWSTSDSLRLRMTLVMRESLPLVVRELQEMFWAGRS